MLLTNRRRSALARSLAGVTLLLAAPAGAQVVPGNPNAANESLMRQGEIRGLQQGQTSQTNTTRMQIQRERTDRPVRNDGPGVIAPRR